MNPKVSVIVPNYKHRQYLHQRIESILRQTYQNFELIILDDFSSDGSDEIIEEYRSDPHTVAISINTENSGSPFVQWRRGIEMSSGEWIWIAESDDYAEPEFLEKMIAAAVRYPQAGLIYCDAHIVTNEFVEYETFADVKNRIFRTDRWSHDHVNAGKNEIENYLLGESTINNGSGVLFNAAILKKMNPFDIKLRYIGDKFAYVKVMAFSDVVYVKDCMNYYRNPFNTKHAGKIIYYVHEQFKVFDWIWRNVPDFDRKKFFKAFYSVTDCSFYRKWNYEKVKIFSDLFQTNRFLFLKWAAWNLVRPFVTRINRNYRHGHSEIPV
ncbi:MAG TPA: glycosyltransferase family A protein [Cyclobacteriaceae bacterium]|nr:glycosyltransferase family A protein [Cyclobacteriaceae bacterium]